MLKGKVEEAHHYLLLSAVAKVPCDFGPAIAHLRHQIQQQYNFVLCPFRLGLRLHWLVATLLGATLSEPLLDGDLVEVVAAEYDGEIAI